MTCLLAPADLAPEMITNSRCTLAVDLFSFGVVLWVRLCIVLDRTGEEQIQTTGAAAGWPPDQTLDEWPCPARAARPQHARQLIPPCQPAAGHLFLSAAGDCDRRATAAERHAPAARPRGVPTGEQAAPGVARYPYFQEASTCQPHALQHAAP